MVGQMGQLDCEISLHWCSGSLNSDSVWDGIKMTRKLRVVELYAILLATAACCLSVAQATEPAAPDNWTPDKEQAAAIGKLCDGWAQIAGGVYLLKQSGQPKQAGRSDLELTIINYIYQDPSPVTTKEMAESAGFQFCLPVMKRKVETGEIKIRS